MAEAKKVFVFDDNRDILDLCTFILEDAGYEIKTSETANEIESQVAAYMPDIIFMDNWLPDLGGIQATKALMPYLLGQVRPIQKVMVSNQTLDQQRSASSLWQSRTQATPARDAW